MPSTPERRRERSKDPEVKRKRSEYNKLYYERKVKPDIQFRQDLLSQFPCISCGESDPVAIDWHHLNEDDKRFHIRDVTRNHDDWWEEVLKCVPVCANCHRKIHHNHLCLIPQINCDHLERL